MKSMNFSHRDKKLRDTMGKIMEYRQLPHGDEREKFGVLVAVPGVQTMENLNQLLEFLNATNEQKDYSIIGSFTADTIQGTCVYCNHC